MPYLHPSTRSLLYTVSPSTRFGCHATKFHCLRSADIFGSLESCCPALSFLLLHTTRCCTHAPTGSPVGSRLASWCTRLMSRALHALFGLGTPVYYTHGLCFHKLWVPPMKPWARRELGLLSSSAVPLFLSLWLALDLFLLAQKSPSSPHHAPSLPFHYPNSINSFTAFPELSRKPPIRIHLPLQFIAEVSITQSTSLDSALQFHESSSNRPALFRIAAQGISSRVRLPAVRPRQQH